MRILHVLPSLRQTYGGPIRAVLDLSARAKPFGLESEILGFGEPKIPDNPMGNHEIHSLAMASPRVYCYSPGLRSWLHENLSRFNGVVLHGMWLYPNWAISGACLKAGVPYACFPHGMLEPWAVHRQGMLKRLKKVLYWHLRERKIFASARCLYFTTERERSLARSAFHLHGMHQLLVPYGVEINSQPVQAPIAMSLNLHEGWKIALFLGRLHPKKNIEFLIEAWHRANVPPPWRLVIAGSGDRSYEARLRTVVRRLGLEDTVIFVGFVTGADKTFLLQRSRWFLLPSLQENFGVAVLEAITNGCPVAISDQVFIGDSLHQESEILSLDVDQWTKFIQERMVDDEWREKLVRLDAALVMQKLNIAKIAYDWAATLTTSFA